MPRGGSALLGRFKQFPSDPPPNQGLTHKTPRFVRILTKGLYFRKNKADSSYMKTMANKIEEMTGTLKLATLIAYATVWMIICFGRM